MYGQLLRMEKRVVKGREALAELHDKHCCLLVGPTGAGKSVQATALKGGKDAFKSDARENLIAKEPIIYADRTMFEIGVSSVSCTKLPSFVPLDADKQTYIVDCPGFLDSNEYDELPNMTLINYIVQKAASVLVLVNISGASIESDGSKVLLKTLTSVLRLLQETGVENV